MTAAIHLTASAPPRQETRHYCPVGPCRTSLPGAKPFCDRCWALVPLPYRQQWKAALAAGDPARLGEIARQAVVAVEATLAVAS